MVKRPLMWMITSFILGIIMARLEEMIALYLLLSIMFLISLLLLVWRVSNRYINTEDRFLFAIPIMIFLGILLTKNQMNPNPMDLVFQDKIKGNLKGTVSMIINNGERYAIYLKDNDIILTDNTKDILTDNTIDILTDNTKNTLTDNTKDIMRDNTIDILPHNMKNENIKIYYSKRVIIYTSEDIAVRVGNKLLVDGSIIKFKHATNLGQFDEAEYNKRKGIDYKVYSERIKIIDNSYSKLSYFLQCIKDKLMSTYRVLLNEKEAGIITAMLLGEKSQLDTDIKTLYQENGIAHILAISGLHVSLIGVFLYGFLKRIGLGQITATSIAIIFIFCYGLLTNFSVSTNRAVVMLVLSLLAKVLGKTYDLLTSTALGAFIILLVRPLQLYDGGFLLSFGAILSIAVLLPVFRDLQVPFAGLITSISVTLVTLPILLYFFFEIPSYSIILNLIVIPLMSFLVLFALIGGIVGCFNLPLGIFIIGGSHYILVFYEMLCQFFSKLPFPMIVSGKPKMVMIILYYIILILFIIVASISKKKKSFFILLFLTLIFVKPSNTQLQITFLDVGQGDSIFLKTSKGKSYLVDGGSTDVKQVGKYRLLPFLKASGIRSLDYALITHADNDHISGIKELIEVDYVKCLVLPRISLQDEAYMSLVELAIQRETKIIYLEKGDVIQENDLKITCYHPYFEFQAEDRNTSSLVLGIEYKQFSALLTGDLEGDAEDLILDRLLEYNLLKVAHHGSRYSTNDNFLSVVKPEFAIISCGKNNKYEHPHQELIKRLEEVNSKIYITKDSGAITVLSDGTQMEISSFLEQSK